MFVIWYYILKKNMTLLYNRRTTLSTRV